MRFPQFAAATGCLACAIACAPPPSGPADGAQAGGAQAGAEASFTQDVPGTAIRFDMVAVPGSDAVKPFMIGRTEVPWELYDVFVYQLDAQSGGSTPATDAVARPTKPYISMDRGFGHAGWPAISMSAHNAKHFCEWLSKKTGRTYRLPTLAEWQVAASRSGITPANALDHAWVVENAEAATHKVGSRKQDAGGLHDLYGNAAEWVVDEAGSALIIGGSYRDAAAKVGASRREPDNPDWNASDPQFPKSVWWLADGGFIGLRVVCEASSQAPLPAPPAVAQPASPASPASPAPPASKQPAPPAPKQPVPPPANRVPPATVPHAPGA